MTTKGGPEGLAVWRGGGAGPVVMWVHGYTLTSALWQPLWMRLPGFAHVGVDLPGHGGSAPLRPGEDLISLGARLADWAQAEGVRHLVGLSLGSTVALQVALAAPGAFETLTMAAPAIGGGPAEASVGERFKEMRQMEAQLGRGPWLAERWMASPPHLFTTARADPALWAEVAPVVRAHGFDELPDFAIARLATPRQPLDRIAALGCRVLLLIGDRELPAFAETARLLAARCRHARLRTLDGAGHLCLLERPGPATALLARHWQAPLVAQARSRV